MIQDRDFRPWPPWVAVAVVGADGAVAAGAVPASRSPRKARGPRAARAAAAVAAAAVAVLMGCASAGDDAPLQEPRATAAGGTGAAAPAAAAAGTPQQETAVQEAPPNTLTQRERQEGWRLLFDGRTTEGWRGYKQETLPAGWQAVDGALTRVSRASDIITTERFRNFELTLEWKTVPGGNSGVFFRAIEGEGPIYFYAPEIQVLDDDGHGDGRSELTSAGANYGLHPAPRGVVRPVGEWNSVRLRVEGNHVQQWMNGQLIVEYEIGSEDWNRRVAASKFSAWPEYGLAPEGHIGLQEHGSAVSFRSIKIRVLP